MIGHGGSVASPLIYKAHDIAASQTPSFLAKIIFQRRHHLRPATMLGAFRDCNFCGSTSRWENCLAALSGLMSGGGSLARKRFSRLRYQSIRTPSCARPDRYPTRLYFSLACLSTQRAPCGWRLTAHRNPKGRQSRGMACRSILIRPPKPLHQHQDGSVAQVGLARCHGQHTRLI
jgi:hypothetical protein